MVLSLTSWVWMVAFDSTAQALDASGDPTGDLAASLERHFDAVHVLRREVSALDSVREASRRGGWNAASMTQGTPNATNIRPGSLDCIAVHDDLAVQDLEPADLVATLGEFHRLLKPGGWFVASSPNTRPKLLGRAPRERQSIGRRQFTRALARGGFREVRCYCIEPRLDRPLVFIPDARQAVAAFESSGAVRSASRWTRRLAARVGVTTPLYPGYFLLARA